MKLIYKKTGELVKVGDRAVSEQSGELLGFVSYFREPRTTASEGKITLAPKGSHHGREYYVSVIGAEWIEREDRWAEDKMREATGTQVTVRRTWKGGAPAACDLCAAPITDEFYDVMILSNRKWANLCPTCGVAHLALGLCRLGTGYGQHYKQDGGVGSHWKVEG